MTPERLAALLALGVLIFLPIKREDLVFTLVAVGAGLLVVRISELT